METKLHPRYIEAINGGNLQRDWRSIAKRVEHADGDWQLVFTTKRYDKGLRDWVFENLKAVGCFCQVVVGIPANQPGNLNPDRVVFARIPHSKKAPSGKIF